MHSIIVRDSFSHVFLYYYFKDAYRIYDGSMNEVYKNSSDIAIQVELFNNIVYKLRGKNYTESPSFFNEISKFLNLPYCYPFEIQFSFNEQFWFEYIINMSFSEVEKNIKSYCIKHNQQIKNSDSLQKLKEDFKNIEAIEYIRKKIIKSENIQNTPKNQGWGILMNGTAIRLN